MSKTALKRALGATGNPALIDTDRVTPKAQGGTYQDGNVRLLRPRAHMRRHGTLRERTVVLAELKSVFDDRVQVMTLRNKINNQLLAYQRRTDDAHPDTVAFLHASLGPVDARMAEIDRALGKAVREYAAVDTLAAVALAVPGVGPITVAVLCVYVDLQKAASASSLWKYAGLDKPSHARYAKGEVSGGNKTLRTVLWNMAVAMMKNRKCAYRLVYDQVKQRLAASDKVTQSRNTQGHLVACAWKDTKACHRHGAALRAVMKHFLADYWYVGREVAGLSTRPLYATEYLGHTNIVQPQQRGWAW